MSSNVETEISAHATAATYRGQEIDAGFRPVSVRVCQARRGKATRPIESEHALRAVRNSDIGAQARVAGCDSVEHGRYPGDTGRFR